MTDQEAIEIAIHCLGVLAEQEVCEECPVFHSGHSACKEVAQHEITALRELQQYREIGSLEECREAAEKQKAKRPIIHKERFSDTYNCPTCGYRLINRDVAGWYGGNRYKFCNECGQAIQWDEDLEDICHTKPDWCQIRPIPEEISRVSLGDMEYKRGWNDCLKEIMKGGEDNA